MPISDDMPWSPSPDGNASPSSLYQAIVFDILMRCNVCKPATVQAWSPPVLGQLPAVVAVQIDFKYTRAIDNASDLKNGETLSTESAGLRAVGTWVPIPNVPVLAFGSPSFGWRGAVPVGTTGLLLFADTILDQWKNSGGPVDPAMYERHSLNCGIFIPTLYHGRNTPTIDPLVDVLGPNDGTAGFEIATGTDKSVRLFTDGPNATIDAATLVKLGAGALRGVGRLGDAVSPNADMILFMSQIVTAFTAINLIIPISVPVPPAGAFGMLSEASAKVKAE
jgi:hypothetical protein